jgi:UDP:flavonoid glycosyltransferase YjiC (YdhE family)
MSALPSSPQAGYAEARHVLLPTLGSAGDVHPFIALGLALRARGHRVTLLTNPLFQPLIESLGLGFEPIGTIEWAHRVLGHPDLWHPRRGASVVLRELVATVEEVYRRIERHAQDDIVVAASTLALGARIAQDRLGIPTASVHLQPTVIRSLYDGGMVGPVRVSNSQPRWLKRALFALLDCAVLDRHLGHAINTLRARLGLAAVRHWFARWMHSPQCTIGFFPPWFAAPQPDWPAHIHLVGFPLWDDAQRLELPPQLSQFVAAGEPPLIFTAGSAASTLHRFFANAVHAARALGARAVLVTNFPEQLPRELPATVLASGYVPFSLLLPRATLLVHHGGIGTLAQAVRAGVPQLILPQAHDQFDNAWRTEQLRLGRSLPHRQQTARRLRAILAPMLDDESLRQRCRGYSARVDSAAALERACELIAALPARGASRAQGEGAR